jgi:hypothetical protein
MSPPTRAPPQYSKLPPNDNWSSPCAQASRIAIVCAQTGADDELKTELDVEVMLDLDEVEATDVEDFELEKLCGRDELDDLVDDLVKDFVDDFVDIFVVDFVEDAFVDNFVALLVEDFLVDELIVR